MLILCAKHVADDGMECHLLLGCSALNAATQSVCHKFRMWLLGIFRVKQCRMDIRTAVIECRE